MKSLGIWCRTSGKILFQHQCENNSTRLTLEAAVAANIDLTGADLTGKDLSYANLPGAALAGAKLSGAKLTGVNFYKANLCRAQMSFCKMTGAKMSFCKLAGANFNRSILNDVNFYRADLSDSKLSHVKLYGATLNKTRLICARIRDGLVLVGSNPIFNITTGGIGQYIHNITTYLTEDGPRFDIDDQSQISREELADFLRVNYNDYVLRLIDLEVVLRQSA